MLFKEFLDLRRKPDLRRGLPDLLNYAYAEDDETIMMKDGARLSAFACAGPDLNSASIEELDAHRARSRTVLSSDWTKASHGRSTISATPAHLVRSGRC